MFDSVIVYTKVKLNQFDLSQMVLFHDRGIKYETLPVAEEFMCS